MPKLHPYPKALKPIPDEKAQELIELLLDPPEGSSFAQMCHKVGIPTAQARMAFNHDAIFLNMIDQIAEKKARFIADTYGIEMLSKIMLEAEKDADRMAAYDRMSKRAGREKKAPLVNINIDQIIKRVTSEDSEKG